MNMTTNMINLLTEHCILAARKGFAWNPVYADVIDCCGNKIGHISCGYPSNPVWNFYPIERLRKPSRRNGDSYQTIAAKRGVKGLHLTVKRKHLLEVIPKWVGAHTIANVHTYSERND
jgi:hypothetical protein